MIINLRGTNGSGKTHIIRGVMAAATKSTPKYGVLGARKPEAYELRIKGVKQPVFLLGSYHIWSGGCDQIQPYDLILVLIEKYAAQGHVLFEGVLISSSYGRVGQLMERWGQDAVMAFLDTPLETCIANVERRRQARGDRRPLNPHNLTSKFNQISKSKNKIAGSGKLRVEDVSSTDGAELILKLLRSAR